MNSIAVAARELAFKAHSTQTYPPKKASPELLEHYPQAADKLTYIMPFTVHLGHVVAVLHRFGHERHEHLIAGAWLHDVLEDTDLDAAEIFRACGFGVLQLVQSVTDEPGATRAERKAKTYPKIVKGGWDSVVLKQADRIANVEASILGGAGHDFLSIYKKEYPDFRGALSVDGDPVMWDHLDMLLGWDRP